MLTLSTPVFARNHTAELVLTIAVGEAVLTVVSCVVADEHEKNYYSNTCKGANE